MNKARICNGYFLIFIFVLYSITTNAQNTWVQIPDYPGLSNIYMTSFGNSNSMYAGTGTTFNPPYNINQDVWEFNLISNSWNQIANYGGFPKQKASSFTVMGLSYIVGGNYLDMWAYDPMNNLWTQKANFPGSSRDDGLSFVIDSFAYYGLGGPSYRSDFWKYDPLLNFWTHLNDCTCGAREQATGFSTNGFGFVAFGNNGTGQYLYDVWKYIPTNDSWIQMNNFPGPDRYYPLSFVINNTAFIVGGENGPSILNDCWQYNDSNDSWVQKANYPGGPISGGIASSAGNFGFVGTGNNGSNNTRQFWKYIPDSSVINKMTENNFESMINYFVDSKNNSILISTKIEEVLSRVYDLSGKLIYENILKGDHKLINLYENPDGLYLLQIKINKSRFNKIIKVYL